VGRLPELHFAPSVKRDGAEGREPAQQSARSGKAVSVKCPPKTPRAGAGHPELGEGGRVKADRDRGVSGSGCNKRKGAPQELQEPVWDLVLQTVEGRQARSQGGLLHEDVRQGGGMVISPLRQGPRNPEAQQYVDHLRGNAGIFIEVCNDPVGGAFGIRPAGPVAGDGILPPTRGLKKGDRRHGSHQRMVHP
jgi:hypothetical protein